MEVLKESEIMAFIDRYDFLTSALQQIAEFRTAELADIQDNIRGFYKETFVLMGRLADIKSLPLEELRVKKLLLEGWIDMAQNRRYMPNKRFEIIKALATEENSGALPPPVATADRQGGEIEKYYHVILGVRWYYDYFIEAIDRTLTFLKEATQPYQTPKSLQNLQVNYDQKIGDMLKEYLTTAEAAELMKISTKTVLRRIENGALKATKHGNSQYRIRRLDVELWLAGYSQ
jgi:excisionase family DNA binding protein